MTRERHTETIHGFVPISDAYECPHNCQLVGVKVAFRPRPITAERFTITKNQITPPAGIDEAIVLLAGDPATDAIDDFANTDRFELQAGAGVFFDFANTEGVTVHAELTYERT